MKKMNYLNLVVLFLLLSGCGKDDEGSPSYEKSAFTGQWELSSSTDSEFQSCPDNPPILIINDSEISFPAINTEDGCHAGSLDLAYEFDGEGFQVNFLGTDVTYAITASSDNEFTWKDNISGTSETYVKAE